MRVLMLSNAWSKLSLLLYAVVVIGCEATDPSPKGRAVSRPDLSIEPTKLDLGADSTSSLPIPAENPPPFADTERRQPLDGLSGWVVNRPREDPLYASFERGRLAYPEDGSSDRLSWQAARLEGDNPLATRQSIYGAFKIEGNQRTNLIIRGDSIAQLWVNGQTQPGDLYGSGRARLPAQLSEGENLLSFLSVARGPVRLTLEESSWPLTFNSADITRPDLREGESATLWLGLPLLTFGPEAWPRLRAGVVESEYFAATVVEHLSISGRSVTPLSFRLEPKGPFPEAGTLIPFRVAVWAEGGEESNFLDLEWEVIERDAPYRQTFRSPLDLSVQYYGVQLPENFDSTQTYALALSLHGASVEAINQARSYSKRPDFIVIAATNRRPFGFDWEEWGHFNALNALDDARRRFSIDESRVYLTGHSMGGHGTWHVGSHHPGLFAALGPSAGWSSFYSYGGSPRPEGPFQRARAHSDTPEYLSNLAQRGIYIIHGDADDNVPLSEGERLFALASAESDDVEMHIEPGAGHWWDGENAAGVDCVDWDPLFEFFRERRLDPLELSFRFRSPSPSYSPAHSYLKLLAAENPSRDLVAISAYDESRSALTLTLENVLAFELDGAGLRDRGIESIEVNGEVYQLNDEPLRVGETSGKGPGRSGPFNQVYRAPFCWVYPDEEPAPRRLAAYLNSYWALIGNGQGCVLPISEVNAEVSENRNLIYLGFYPEELPLDLSLLPFSWDDLEVSFRDVGIFGAAAMSLVPRPIEDLEAALRAEQAPPAEGQSPAHLPGRLDAILSSSYGWEHLLYRVNPFSSRTGMPVFLLWNEQGLIAAGLYDARWRADDQLIVP